MLEAAKDWEDFYVERENIERLADIVFKFEESIIKPLKEYGLTETQRSTDRKIPASSGTVPVVIDEQDSDTWVHGIFSFRREVAWFTDASVKLIEERPLQETLRVIS